MEHLLFLTEELKKRGLSLVKTCEPPVKVFAKLPIPDLELAVWIYPTTGKKLLPLSCQIQIGIRIVSIENIVASFRANTGSLSMYHLYNYTFCKVIYPNDGNKILDEDLLVKELSVFDEICKDAYAAYDAYLNNTRQFIVPTEFPNNDVVHNLKRTATLLTLEKSYNDEFIDTILKENPIGPSYTRNVLKYINWLKHGDVMPRIT
jgi:hypothetical protein